MSELTAALATIEKYREITGCPAGVGLQDHLRKLVAERDASLNVENQELKRRIAELESRTAKLPTTRLWAGVTECYEKSDVIAAIRAAGMEVSDD